MENRKTKEPLLYIDQPPFKKPEAFMQQNYSSLMKPKNESTQFVVKERPKRERRHRINPFVEMLEQEIAQSEVEIDEPKQREHDNNDEKFNDLSIQGKIDYFINLPAEMPKMRSEIELENDVYRGYILEDNGTDIKLKTGRTSQMINKEEIKNIILIGF